MLEDCIAEAPGLSFAIADGRASPLAGGFARDLAVDDSFAQAADFAAAPGLTFRIARDSAGDPAALASLRGHETR